MLVPPGARTAPPVERRPRWPVVAAALVYVAVALACGSGQMTMPDLVPAGAAALLVAIWGFYRQGRAVLNGSSLFCYAIGLFIAFPAIYVGLTNWPAASDIAPRWLLLALSIGVVGMCVTMVLGGEPGPRTISRHSAPERVLMPPVAALVLGGTLLVLALLLVPVDATLGTRIPQALGGLSLFVVALGLADARTRVHVVVLAGALVSVGAVYYLFLFSAFGRLVLGSLACGVLAILSIRRRNYLIKSALLLGTAPGLVFLAQQRADYVVATWNYRAPSDLGIASVIGPFVSFAKILIASSTEVISPTWGSTLWASSVFWVPRQFWPNKPDGFGAEMVAITQPGNIHLPGFSDAATVFGEAVWNLGLLLLPVALVVIGLSIGWLDRLVARAAGGAEGSAVRVLALAVLLGGILNLAWGGTFTFVTRATGMLVLLGLAWLALRLMTRSAAAVPTDPAVAGSRPNGRDPDGSVLSPSTNAVRASGGQKVLDDDVRRPGD